jgi:uncharacterized protein Usg
VNTPKNNSQQGWLLLLIIIVGLVARMEMATLGHNYDMASYRIVVGILDQGGSVYADTERYNYGPVWFVILHGLDILAGHNETIFRYLVAGFLSLVDVGICLFLWRKFGYVAASLFFLNPISIIITGFHSQFDNLAILLGMAAVLIMGDDFDKPVDRRKFGGLALLGFSLMTKHLFFVFPFWLAVKQKGIWQKVIVVLVPVLVFLAGFVPYWHEGKQGIIQNVFHYHSVTNQYFYNMFVPLCLQNILSSRTVWFVCLAVFAFIHRRKSAIEFLLAYTCVLVATSPAIVNQYLAIPIAFAATRWNVFTTLYTMLGTWVLLVHRDDLHIIGLLPQISPNIPICALCFAMLWAAWPQEIVAAFRAWYGWWVVEIKNQLRIKQ